MGPEQQPPLPEHEPKPQWPVFDLEQLEAADIVRLYAALEGALDEDGAVDKLVRIIERRLKELPIRNLDKAREVFFSMAAHENGWVRAAAASLMGLLLKYDLGAENKSRQEVLATWARLRDDKDSACGEAVYLGAAAVIGEEWLDPEIDGYLRDYILP